MTDLAVLSKLSDEECAYISDDLEDGAALRIEVVARTKMRAALAELTRRLEHANSGWKVMDDESSGRIWADGFQRGIEKAEQIAETMVQEGQG